MSWKKSLGNFGEIVAATAAMVTIAFFLWGFYLSLKIIGDLGGFWPTIAAGLLYPFVFLVMPWYAGLALGDWTPLWISYVAFWAAAFTASGGAILSLKMSPLEPRLPAGTENASAASDVPNSEASQN